MVFRDNNIRENKIWVLAIIAEKKNPFEIEFKIWVVIKYGTEYRKTRKQEQ